MVPDGSAQAFQALRSMAPSSWSTRWQRTSVRKTFGGSVVSAVRMAASLTVWPRPGLAAHHAGGVVEFASVSARPLEQADGRVPAGQGGVAQLVEDDGLVVAGVGHGPDLRPWPGHRGLGQGRPGVPVPLLAEFVDVEFVDADSPRPALRLLAAILYRPPLVSRNHSSPLTLPDLVEFGGEVGAGVDGVEGAAPLLAGEADVLGDAEDEAGAVDVEPPEADHALELDLPFWRATRMRMTRNR